MAYSEAIQENTQISKYNEAGLATQRLHELQVKAEYYAENGLLEKWKFALDAIRRELHANIVRMTDSDKIRKKDIQLRIKISSAKTRAEKYHSLDKRHRFLMYIKDKSGRGNVYVDQNHEGFE